MKDENDKIDNEEIARYHPIALELVRCPKCNHLFEASIGLKKDEPCPSCGEKEIRYLYPSAYALEYQKMVSYLYVKMAEEIERKKKALVAEVEQRIGKKYDEETLVQLSKKIRGIAHEKGDNNESYEEILSTIGNTLSIGLNEVKNILGVLFDEVEETYEGKVVLVFSCCLFDFLEKDLLKLYLEKQGFEPIPIHDYLYKKETRTNKERNDFKKNIEGIRKPADEQRYFHEFWIRVDRIIKKRDIFIHRTPYVDFSLDNANEAFELSQQAPYTYAKLQNELIKKGIL